MRLGEISRRGFLFALIISIVISFIVIPAFSEAQTKIWTEDEQGNERSDFEPNENVYIRGSGFDNNVPIDIIITRPDNVVENHSTSSDENGCFLYIYTLDGMEGTYSVTATDGVNSASTTFTDGLITAWVKSWGPPTYPQEKDNFLDNENVYAMIKTTGKGSKTVRIYVVENEAWKNYVPLVDVSGDNYNVVILVGAGEHGPFLIWQAPTIPGGYDIVVDEDNDGIRDPGEKVDDSNPPPGFIIAQIPVRNVEVSISPAYQSGLNGQTLSYTVIVINTGNVSDTYDLSASDDLGWSPSISPTSLTVPAGENRSATLSVTIPDNATGGTQDTITVTATSQADNTVSDSFACVARVLVARGVDVSISPPYQSGVPGENLIYAVTVANIGNVSDTYDLTVSENLDWNPSISPSSVTVLPFSSGNATLSVTVPMNAIGSTQDNITVAATSQADNTVSDSASCIAHATIVRAVEVSISPSYQTGLPGATLNYTVTVANTGNVSDTYGLVAGDNLGWGPTVSPTSLTAPPWENRTATLSVTVPENAEGCTQDNIWVVATSQANPAINDNDSSIAHAGYVIRGVDLSVSPNQQSGKPGAVLSYTVTAVNTGNVEDNYTLNATDNENWGLTVSPTSLVIPPGGSDNALLTASIPGKARGSTKDNIRVIAASVENSEVSASGVGIASVENVRGVLVEITPSYKGGLGGTILEYSCRITNTGNVEDTYDITFWDNENWNVAFTIEAIHLPPYSWAETTPLKVTVAENAVPSTEDNITIRAVSRSDNTIENRDSCIAHRDWAELTLITKYLVNVDLNFYVENGSKLAMRFYDFSDVFEGENIILENLATPTQVIFIDNVPHPLGMGIKKVALVALSDNGSITQTVQTFVTRRDDLWRRLMEIRAEWPYATTEGRDVLWAEIMDIRAQWPYSIY